MTTSATWPTRKNTVATAGDDYAGRPAPPGRELPEHELAHQIIGEMADLLRDVLHRALETDGPPPEPAVAALAAAVTGLFTTIVTVQRAQLERAYG